MDNNFNTPENNNEVSFRTDETITVVEENSETKSKKLPIIIAICLLVVALVAGIIIYATKDKTPDVPDMPEVSTDEEVTTNPYQDFINSALSEVITDTDGNEIDRNDYVDQLQQQLEAATTQLNEYVGSYSPNEIVENTTAAGNNDSQAETTTANAQQVNKAEAQIKAFFDRKCYIQGALYSGNEGNPLAISFDGENFEALTNLDGIEVSMMKLDGVMYIKRPALNQYVEFTDAVMSFMGFEEGDLSFDFGTTNYETMKSKLKNTYDVTINGEEGVCYVYQGNDQELKFYSANGSLKQIEIYSSEGTLVSQIMISYFSTSIPADQLSLKGYTKTGVGTIFADVLNQ